MSRNRETAGRRPQRSEGRNAPPQSFEPLTEDEVNFCWCSLADHGQLSLAKLRAFMLDVCGEDLSVSQARDLLNYMDANLDGKVGLDEFKNFLSVGTLADTDPPNFMWRPNAKYLEECGVEKAVGEPITVKDTGLQAMMNLFSLPYSPTRDLVTQSTGQLSSHGSMHSLSDLEPQPSLSHPCATIVAQQPHRRPLGKGPSTHPLAAQGASTSRQRSSVRNSQMAQMPNIAQTRKEDLLEEAPHADRIKDPKMLEKIDRAIGKYEQNKWQTFLKYEEQCKNNIFAQFVSAESSGKLTAMEYHRMLTRWRKHAKWCMPGDQQPGDSVAALQLALMRETEGRDDTTAARAPQVDAAMPYGIWLELISGKRRPEDCTRTAQSERSLRC